jgi:hypothetical protein
MQVCLDSKESDDRLGVKPARDRRRRESQIDRRRPAELDKKLECWRRTSRIEQLISDSVRMQLAISIIDQPMATIATPKLAGSSGRRSPLAPASSRRLRLCLVGSACGQVRREPDQLKCCL